MISIQCEVRAVGLLYGMVKFSYSVPSSSQLLMRWCSSPFIRPEPADVGSRPKYSHDAPLPQ